MQCLLRPVISRSFIVEGIEKKPAATAIRPNAQNSLVLQSRRSFITRFADNRHVPACDEASLGRIINLEFARKIYRENVHRIVARAPDLPPSELGLMALIAYTSGPLHQKINEYESPCRSLRKQAEMCQIAQWKRLIADTILRIKKNPVPVVRRNTQLGLDALAGYAVGATIRVDRLTSVTCASRQVYTGGNTDLVIHTSAGVVSVAPLSAYADSEAEGMLDPGSSYKVVEVISGKENGRRSPDDASYPARTIVLQEL